MNWITLIVNVVIIALLAIIPTLLGESLNNIVYIIYLITIVVLSAIIQVLMSVNEKKGSKIEQLEETNNGLEKRYNNSILSLKAQGINYFDVAIQPLFYVTPRCNQDYNIRLIVNSRTKLSKKPEITLTSDKDIDVKKPNAIVERYFHNDYHYFLLNQTLQRDVENMFYHYEFNVKFKEPGENSFKFLVESKELSSEIKNSFFIQ